MAFIRLTSYKIREDEAITRFLQSLSIVVDHKTRLHFQSLNHMIDKTLCDLPSRWGL